MYSHRRNRSLYNVTIGNVEVILQSNLSKVVVIAEDTKSIIKSFKRNDV
jgi:hypothetical protein